ncbi:potassium channel family protein [Chromobacterium sp. IIBBL 290-4]|uniref:potassium channel family protein n=1 Tax=Chromobacterium sp. IIBBL 290-4 TaxID=2953890 RepID=UPI0020B778AE|nr:potassium channel family protein [Chromobacterium sp. IIBBL 290-4]UTH73426.1 potassium channel family protein [Chromobacterium sp. IIBBL 290-4]
MASLPLPSLETKLQLHASTALSLGSAVLFTWLWHGLGLHSALPRQGEEWLAWAVFFWPISRTIRHIIQRPRQRQLGDLIGLYIGLVLQFAVVYYLFALLLTQGTPFHGMTALYSPGGEPLPGFYGRAALLFLDCFHLSIATAATVGYGDMYPTYWPIRLLADLQIIFTTALVIIGFGKHFSTRDAA